MTRILLSVLLPVVLPTAVYFLYAWYAARRARVAGSTPERIDVPWSWLAIAGFGLLIVSLGINLVYGTYQPGQRYEPAHIEGGKIVPGRTGK